MDPSAMDFVMHHADQANSHSPSSSIDHASRSACPALRAAAENHQHPTFSPPRPHYRFDPVHNGPQFWQGLPPSFTRWTPEGPYQSAPPVMPPNPSQAGQSPYPSSHTSSAYNMQQSSYRHRGPMPGLQRIGGTAPIQHSQAHFSASNHGQPQVGIAGGGGTGPGPGPGAGGPLPHNSRANSTLPSLNPIQPPLATGQGLQTHSFPQNSRSTQQPGRHSPSAFVRQMSEAAESSSGRNDSSSSQSSSPSPPRRAAAMPQTTEMASEATISEQTRANAIRSRRGLPRLPSTDSNWSSDDDSDSDAVALRLLEAAAGGPVAEERLRAHQIMRGAAAGKRVASKKALTSLESVTISDLPENERTCVICYNDYGVETPEGISEAPLRLPKCKHVFGDHCIKKWFEESDSCPYCRDKVHSEPQFRHVVSAHNVYRFIRQHHQMHFQTMQMRNARELERGDSDSLSRPPETPFGPGFSAWTASPFEVELGTMGAAPGRRAEGPSMYSNRPLAMWNNPGERYSPLPFADGGENRRRVRPRHGSLRGLPPGRPHYAASPANSAAQSQGQGQGQVHPQYSWTGRANPVHSHSRQHSASSTAASRPAYDTNVPPFPYQSQIGAPGETYLNPLNMPSSTGPPEDYQSLPRMRPQHLGPVSPTFPGPEIYMSDSNDPVFGGSVSHQQL
ncbi:hypothetical protein GGR54DRAFT_655119 [Hypoxylon sp. NC1633]|nr:hypothetical protein GGR54DRAFT_655119 [Hypoxylon sp. NC1633]